MQQNQVYVIQVNTNNGKIPLALPPPPGTILPSEVKYSASLVRGLGCAHLVLGAVLFLLGVLGSWVEPETCWSGAGVWGGIATIICGTCGLFAYHLWYKNYTIKAFLVSSVVCVVISVLAIILIIYALINRHEQFYNLLQQAENKPWFKPYNTDQEHQLTVSVSANLMVGFVLEFILAVWSVKIGWKGVRAEEFSSSRRDTLPDDLQSIVSTPQHNGQQVPLAALYQLLQAHPELLGSKSVGGGLGHPWLSNLDDRPSHRSMDYQERVSRFLSHAIEDQNPSFSRSPSTIQEDIQENPSPSGGRGSPSSSADTAVVLPDQSLSNPTELSPTVISEKPSKPEDQQIAKVHAVKVRNGEPKSRAPLPKEIKEVKEKIYKENKSSQDSGVVVEECKESDTNIASEKNEEKEKHKKKNKEKTSSSKDNNEAQPKEENDKAHTGNTDANQSNHIEGTVKQKNKKDKEQGKTSTDNAEKNQAKEPERTEKEKSKKEKEHGEINIDTIAADQSKRSERTEKQKSKKEKEHSHENTNDVDRSKQSERTENHKNKKEKGQDHVHTNVTDQSNPSEREEKHKTKKEKEQNHINTSNVDQSTHSEKTEKQKSKKDKERDHVSTSDVDQSNHSEKTEKQKSKKDKERDHVSTNDVDQSKQSERTEKQKSRKDKERDHGSTNDVDQRSQSEITEKQKIKKEKEQDHAHLNDVDQSNKSERTEKKKSKKEKEDHVSSNDADNSKQSESREKQKSKKEKEQSEINTDNADESKQIEKSEKKKRKKEKEQKEASTTEMDVDHPEYTEKNEKHKKSKKEKHSHITEELENKDQDTEQKEKKKHKKSEKHGKPKSRSSVTNESESAHSDISPKASTVLNLSAPQQINSANTSDSTGLNKDLVGHVLDIKPPSEFQDVELEVKS